MYQRLRASRTRLPIGLLKFARLMTPSIVIFQLEVFPLSLLVHCALRERHPTKVSTRSTRNSVQTVRVIRGSRFIVQLPLISLP
jgi:hypothetical protein